MTGLAQSDRNFEGDSVYRLIAKAATSRPS